MKKITNSVGALLLMNMAHISGLVAADIVDLPFWHSNMVTSTTHKTLQGQHLGMNLVDWIL